MKAVKLVAEAREVRGTGPVGRIRKQGIVPAVVYGSGKEARLIQLNAHDFEQTLRGHASEHMLMDLEVAGGAPVKVLLKEVQHHPVTGRIIHADFNEISMTKKIRVEIPIKLIGEPLGVSQQGGVLEHIMRTVEVECLPTDILEQVSLDVSGLHIGESLTISSIKLDETKFTVLSPKEFAVAAVAAPRLEEEVAPAAVEGAEAAPTEPEVIREKKEGEEGEEGEEGAGEGAKGEGKGAGKAEARAGSKPEAKAGGKPEAKAGGKPEARAGGKPEARAGGKGG
jgi:large subunit ribosomal protein L25